MDDYTIHMNVRVNKIGDKNVAVVKERLWRPLVSFHHWVSKGIDMPGFVYDGLGLTFITNSAIIVEGVIADIIDEHWENSGITSNWGADLERATWVDKKNKYNSTFQKKLEQYKGFDAVEVLFKFRNNVAHGLAHIEVSSIQEITNNKTELESVNNKYQAIRNFLINRRFITPTDTSSNTNHLWNFRNAAYLWFEAKCFLDDVLSENESTFKEGIISEWKTANSGHG